MKYLFVVILLLLLVASGWIWMSAPSQVEGVPVLYWMTDANPARQEQVAIFHQWLADNDYPRFVLKTDSANNSEQKKIIQGVSGVAGDIIDIYGGQMRFFNAVGLLEDITTPARKMGFSPSATFPALEPDITIQGRQYRFPCNVGAHLVWVNVDEFRRVGMEPPPRHWDFQTFEKIGKEYVRRANKGLARQQRFFHSRPNNRFIAVMRRSLGLSCFNETETRCLLDDSRNIRILRLLRKWTDEVGLFPTAADAASFATESGYGGSRVQLFHSGEYAMTSIGRFILIQLRQMPPLRLSVSYPPHGGFENVMLSCRAAGVYTGSPHKDLAYYFLKFLATESYNMHIVRDSDAMPPNPVFTDTDAYLKPSDWPNEWDCHRVEAEAALTVGIGPSFSPFVLDTTVQRLDTEGVEEVLAGVLTPEEAARKQARRVNEEIARSVKENSELEQEYERRVERQSRIDELRRNGKKVPLELIDNRFHRDYYVAMGWSNAPPGSDRNRGRRAQSSHTRPHNGGRINASAERVDAGAMKREACHTSPRDAVPSAETP